jgi:hypothetical protein
MRTKAGSVLVGSHREEVRDSVVVWIYRAGFITTHLSKSHCYGLLYGLAAFVLAVEEEGDGCGALLAARTYGTLPNNAGALFCALFSFSRQNRYPRSITFEQHSIEVEIISVFFKDYCRLALSL